MNARQPSNRAICITLFALLSCTCLLGCFPAAHQPLQKTGFYFNTVITVTLSKGGSDALLEEAFHIADRYEDMFSATIASSDISRINQARGKAVSVSEETIALLEKGLQYCALSDGGFDITWQWYTPYEQEYKQARDWWRPRVTMEKLGFYLAFKGGESK